MSFTCLCCDYKGIIVDVIEALRNCLSCKCLAVIQASNRLHILCICCFQASKKSWCLTYMLIRLSCHAARLPSAFLPQLRGMLPDSMRTTPVTAPDC